MFGILLWVGQAGEPSGSPVPFAWYANLVWFRPPQLALKGVDLTPQQMESIMAQISPHALETLNFTISLMQINAVRNEIGESVLALQQLCRLLDYVDDPHLIETRELTCLLRPLMRQLDAAMGDLDHWQEVEHGNA